jgi:hypothetical protein
LMEGITPNSSLEIKFFFFPLNDTFIQAARGGNLGLTELCKELGAASNIVKNGNNHLLNDAMAAARVELPISHRAPPQVVDRGKPTRYGRYRGNQIPGANQNRTCCLAGSGGIHKG